MGADIDPVAVQAYELNLRSPALLVDLASLAESPSQFDGLDVLLAGPPCQGFSTAGTRKFEDPRNSLLTVAASLAVRLSPRVFLLENVPAVRSGCHRAHWEAAKQILSSSGYDLQEMLYDTGTLGMAQLRRRIILLASRGPIALSPLHPNRPSTLSDALEGVANVPDHTPIWPAPDSTAALIAPRIPQGHKLSNVRASSRSVHTWQLPELFGRTSARGRRILEYILHARRRTRVRPNGDADPVPLKALRAAFGQRVLQDLSHLKARGYLRNSGRFWDLTHTFNGKYRRLAWTAPAPTVHTKFGDARYFLHPTEHRGFTVREAARLQGFPDTYIFKGNLRQQFLQVGNAVPPPLAFALAHRLRATLDQ